ncbi:hypothetical protein PISMIDRAFT_79551, partial [Pisolithus microcarpus 441]
NVSDLKQMAAHDFEDLLQCAIPVFTGLLPEPHNGQIIKLLFVLAHWHGLVKLRMHTDETLNILEHVTWDLGNRLRSFADETCSAFSTRELQRETESHMIRQARLKGGSSARFQINAAAPGTTTSCHSKVLNLCTYKLHALGDYVSQIRLYGTTDSFLTQPV